MISAETNEPLRSRKPCLTAALFVLAAILWSTTRADEANNADDDLDITMEVISDPKAERPSEVLQKIPLPKPKAEKSAAVELNKDNNKNENSEADMENKKEGDSDESDANDQRGIEGRETGAGEEAQERAREAREQRDEARDENRRESEPREPPRGRPDRPGRP